MIVFNKLWTIVKKEGLSTYNLQKDYGIDSKTIKRLKSNENVETKTLNRLCIALNCKLDDIAEFVNE